MPATYLELFAAPPPLAPQGTGESSVNNNNNNNRRGSTYSNSGSSAGTAVAPTTTAAGASPKRKGPAVAPRRGARKLRYVVALYAYAAQNGDTEHSMAEGERFVLVKDDPGDGWVEVEKGGATKSVPASYVQVVAAD